MIIIMMIFQEDNILDCWPDMPDLPTSLGILQTYSILKTNYSRIECKILALCILWSKCVTACNICYPTEIGKINLKFVTLMEAFISSKYYKC